MSEYKNLWGRIIANESLVLKTAPQDTMMSQAFGSCRLFAFDGLTYLFLALPLIIFMSCQVAGTKPVSVSIKALVGLKYDVVRFKVKPGAKVELELSNVSDMGHNLIITNPGRRMDVVNAACSCRKRALKWTLFPGTMLCFGQFLSFLLARPGPLRLPHRINLVSILMYAPIPAMASQCMGRCM